MKYKDRCSTILLATVFVILGSSKLLLTKLSTNKEKQYDYLPVTVNVCSEILKLLFCTVFALHIQFYTRRKTFSEVFFLSKAECLQFLKWSVPGLLYFMDNLIAFCIIRYFQPAMVVLLDNFGIITTSVMFRLILKHKLSNVQWASLAILLLSIISLCNQSKDSMTIDHRKHHEINHFQHVYHHRSSVLCTVTTANRKQNSDSGIMGSTSNISAVPHAISFHLTSGHLLVILKCFISSAANIYNEKIFKDGPEESIYVQNCKLYIFGVFFNAMSLLVHDHYRKRLLNCGFFHGHNAYSVILIFVTTFYGLAIALMLKFRDNMFYLMSAQITTVTMVTASIYLFGFEPGLDFFLIAPVVLLAVYIYNVSKYVPLSCATRSQKAENKHDNTNQTEEYELLQLSRDDELMTE